MDLSIFPSNLLFSLLFRVMGVSAFYNVTALCVHITKHATLQTQLAIRGQLQRVTVPLKIIVTLLFNDGFHNVKMLLKLMKSFLGNNTICVIASSFYSRKKIQK